MHKCAKFGPDRASCLVYFPHFFNVFPLQMPHWARGVNCLAYVHSLMNLYTCAKFDPDWSSGLEAFPDS